MFTKGITSHEAYFNINLVGYRILLFPTHTYNLQINKKINVAAKWPLARHHVYLNIINPSIRLITDNRQVFDNYIPGVGVTKSLLANCALCLDVSTLQDRLPFEALQFGIGIYNVNQIHFVLTGLFDAVGTPNTQHILAANCRANDTPFWRLCY